MLTWVSLKPVGELLYENPVIALEYRGCSEVQAIKYTNKKSGLPAVMYKLELRGEGLKGEQVACSAFADDPTQLTIPPFQKGETIIVVVESAERDYGKLDIRMIDAFPASAGAPAAKK